MIPLLFILMSTVCIILYCKLREYRKRCTNGQNTLQRESQTICQILFVFSFSYLLRFVYDYDSIMKKYINEAGGPFGFLVLNVILMLFFDIIPIFLVALFHYRNHRRS